MFQSVCDLAKKKASGVATKAATSVATSVVEKGLIRLAPCLMKRNPVGAIVGLATAITTKAVKGELTGKNAAGDCLKAGAGWGMAQAGLAMGAIAGPAGMAVGGIIGGAIGVFAGDFVCKKCDLD